MSNDRGKRILNLSQGVKGLEFYGQPTPPASDPDAKYHIVTFDKRSTKGDKNREIGIICTHWLLPETTSSGLR
jgi:hypothetical protein